MSRRVLVLSLVTSTLLGAEVMESKTSPGTGDEVVAVGLTPALGYAAARYMRAGPIIEVGLAAGGAERAGALMGAFVRGMRIGGSTGRLFGGIGIFAGAAIGGM